MKKSTRTAQLSGNTAGFRRNSNILRRKFYQFLLPSILSYAAGCLNQFLDSIVVAQVLDSTAMSYVNMANPLILVLNTFYVLLGTGGSTLYATLKGRMEKKHASAVFTLTMLFAVIFSGIVLVGGLLFLQPMTRAFSSGLETSAEFVGYVRILVFTSPFIILTETILMFFPVEGAPQIATVINIVANTTNILCDILYMTVFHMGLKGAAYATLTGYALAVLMILYALIRRKCTLGFCRVVLKDLKDLKGIVAKGAASSVSQIGYCIKVSFSNYMAVSSAGTIGIVIFSACYQTIMIVSIFIGGILNAMSPIVAVLYGQEDYKGIRLLMKNILKMELAVSVVVVAFFEACPALILKAFGVTTAGELAIGIPALRIFSIMYLFRHTMVLFLNCFQIIGRKIYAVVLSLLDGFVAVVPIALLLCFVFHMKITGLWLAYPVYSALLLSGLLIVNYLLVKHSGGKLQSLYLLPAAEKDAAVLDISLPGDPKELSKFTETFEHFCLDHQVDRKKAAIAAVACEEICVFAYSQEERLPEIDIMIRVSGEEIRMDFRSIGRAFDPLSIPKEEQYSNTEVLSRLAREIRYDYILGMNQTQILI